ncbi:DNA/RNA helicase domain-containing protein [Nocardia tengchongensis]|uniref:DNA/RNA helicase domain-containing protein n=1 Tax=Nocardia tengchongensis TaxID=2055889 RepID=UPI00361E01DF
MALVRGSAGKLLSDAQQEQLSPQLVEQAGYQWGQKISQGEVNSWLRSLPQFLSDLVDAGLGEVEVLLEHRLPHSPKRVDVILCGVHPRTGVASYVLVELKQWSKAELIAAELVSADLDPATPPRAEVSNGRYTALHPAAQVHAYCQYLVDATPALAERRDCVFGIAYLHNAHDADVRTLLQYPPADFGQMFTMDNRAAMVDRLRAVLSVDAGRDMARAAADDFLSFHHAPSKALLTLAAKEIQDREQFVLLDEQRIAYQLVMQAVAKARAARNQTVVVVLGGPGSGKSVIALSLLGELARKGRTVHHATGSKAFTKTMRRVAGSRNKRVQDLFKYFNNYIGAEPRELDVIICDEAHRLRETSINRYTTAEVRAKAGPQIEELINVAAVPVFLLDENQIVRPGEMGSLEDISAAAVAAGCQLEVVRLDGQFRCGGSESFDIWVARLLGLHPEQPIPWSKLTAGTDDDFRVTSAASPIALEAWLTTQQEGQGGTARIAAGYCWPWSDPVDTPTGRRLVDDVVIGGWRRPWNAKDGKRVPDVPVSDFWASDDRGFGQVGCVYTAQGFEYDWAGVIFGPDFVRRGDRWEARPQYSHDPAVKKADSLHFMGLIRNTYKVLLTRGMEGVSLYSTDPETQEFLERMTI